MAADPSVVLSPPHVVSPPPRGHRLGSAPLDRGATANLPYSPFTAPESAATTAAPSSMPLAPQLRSSGRRRSGRRRTGRASTAPSLAPTGTLPGVPIGAAAAAAALSGAAGRLSGTPVATARRPSAKLRRRRGVRGDTPAGGLRKHVRVAQVRFVNFEKINLEYSLGKNAPTAFKPSASSPFFFIFSRGNRLVMYFETKL